jgi:hypothetical protein
VIIAINLAIKGTAQIRSKMHAKGKANFSMARLIDNTQNVSERYSSKVNMMKI